MLKRHPRTYRNLIVLIALTGAAFFTIYYLYFRQQTDTGQQTIVAQKVDIRPSSTISSKVTHHFTDTEKRTVFANTPGSNAPLPEPPSPAQTLPMVETHIEDIPGDPHGEPIFMMPMPQETTSSTLSPQDDGTTAAPPASSLDSKPTDRSESHPTERMIQYWRPFNDVSDEKIPTLLGSDESEPIEKIFTPQDRQTERMAHLSLDESPARDTIPPSLPAVKTASPERDNPAPEKTLPEKMPPQPAQSKPVDHNTPAAATPPSSMTQTPADNQIHQDLEKQTKENASVKKTLNDHVWVVNVLSTQDDKKLWEVFTLLSQYPYRVYTYTAQVKGKDWKRIRIGFFRSKQKAEVIGREISKKHGLPSPWIVRLGPEEMKKYYME